MSTIRLVAAAAVAGLLVGALAFAGQGPKVGANAPAFSAKGTDGKTYDLAALTKKGDLHLYFIKIGCPVNHRAAPHFKKLAETYGDKANIVGVINGTPEEAKAWAKEYGAKFLILSDADLKIIRAYGAQYSPWAVVVSKGKIAAQYAEGASKALPALNKRAAATAKTKLVALNFDGAPSGGG